MAVSTSFRFTIALLTMTVSLYPGRKKAYKAGKALADRSGESLVIRRVFPVGAETNHMPRDYIAQGAAKMYLFTKPVNEFGMCQ